MAEALADRRRERDRLLSLAREYVASLHPRLPLVAAAVVGSVARGDFNVWSDVDVVVVAEDLPPRSPDRGALLATGAPPGVQPVGFTQDEFAEAWGKANPLAREATQAGVILVGEVFFRRFSDGR